MIYLGNNSIGDEGCRHLSSAKWNNITHLSLCIIMIYSAENSIGAEGCRDLSTAEWNNLTMLDLC